MCFIRNAFSHYLSTDVINELVADPDKLELGGEKKYQKDLSLSVFWGRRSFRLTRSDIGARRFHFSVAFLFVGALAESCGVLAGRAGLARFGNILVLLGTLLVLTQGSAVAPFIYTLF